MVAVPDDEHVAAAVVTVGVAGVINCCEILKIALTDDVHSPFPDVTV